MKVKSKKRKRETASPLCPSSCWGKGGSLPGMQGTGVKGGTPAGGPRAAAYFPARLCHQPPQACLPPPASCAGAKQAPGMETCRSVFLGPELVEGQWMVQGHWVVLQVRSFRVSLLSSPLASANDFPAAHHLWPSEARRRAGFVGHCVLPGGSQGQALAQLGRWGSEELGMVCLCCFCFC